jgi:hypothetical protein
MKTRQLLLGMSGIALMLTGCASGGNSGSTAAGGAGMSMAPGQAMAGMSMAPGQAMAGMSMAPGQQSTAGQSTAPAAGEPSKAAKMVCTGDVRDEVKSVLKLSSPAPISTSWRDGLYTCTYTLPMGKMVLSVKESAGKPAAIEYFQALRTRLGSTRPAPGLGEQAYATTTGTVVVLKDNTTLRVDTTGLPAVFGPQQQRRTDLAYEIASVVLGCWIEHVS